MPHYRPSGEQHPRRRMGARRPNRRSNRRKAPSSEKLDFIGLVLLAAMRYPISVVIWRACRMLVEEVLEDPTWMVGRAATADDLLQIRGQIDANIDIRKDYKIGQLGRG